MEFVTLDSVFQPNKLIENYESLLWTERYSSAGDFKLTSADVEKTLANLPLESYVSLRESVVPMVVESHKIVKPKGKYAYVEVQGRSFESVLERRGSAFSLPSGAARALWTVTVTKTSDAAYIAIRTIIGDSTARVKGGVTVLNAISPSASALDAISEINLPIPSDYAYPSAAAWSSVTPYAIGAQVTHTGIIWEALQAHTNVTPVAGATWKSMGVPVATEIKAGNLYNVVMELLAANRHGMKAVRPPAEGGKTTVDVEIYNGADLTNLVSFDARFDQFDDATYLLSYQGSTNIAYVFGGGTGAPAGGTSVRKNTVGGEVSGLARRVLVVDEMTDATLNTAAIRTSRGLVELYKNNSTAIFDGQTSIQIASLFNKPVAQGGYGLGDILKLNGEYGLTRNVRVEEFIRSADSSGEKAYPAFQVVDE